MADDDEVAEGVPFDPTFATAGPRRSTFTPPTGSTPAQPDAPNAAPPAPPAAEHDDDALADALAADISRISTGAIPTAPTPFAPPTPEPVEVEHEVPVESAFGAPAASPAPGAYDFGQPATGTFPAAPESGFPPPSSPPAFPAPAPWSSFPAPDPAQAVALPDPTALPAPPTEEPAPPSPTLEAIERLQAELEQRERESRGSWAQRPVDLPAPPDAASAPAPPAQQPVSWQPDPSAFPSPPAAPQSPFIAGESPVSAWPFPSFGEAPAPEVAATPSPEPWQRDATNPPPFDAPAPPAPEPPAPTPALPAWEIPAPGPNWAPGPEYGMEDPEPQPWEPPRVPSEAPPAPLAEPAPVADATPAPTAEPAPEPVIQAELVDEPPAEAQVPPAYIPPPLVEPTQHGPPLLPSQAAGRPPLVISPEFGAPPVVAPPTGIPVDAPAPTTPPVDAPPPLVEPGSAPAAPAPNWAAPTGGPLAPRAGDTLEAPTLDADALAAATAAAGASAPRSPFSFDDLVGSSDGPPPADEEPLLYPDPEPATAADSAAEAIFIEPMPVAAGEAVPTDTGSITIIDQAYEEELPDDVDETDRAVPGLGAVSVDTAGIAVVTGTIHPPSGPISTVRIPEDEVVLSNNEPVRMKVFSLEGSGLDATPVDHRVGRAARLFWLWFASNSSILSLGLGATVFAVGMSLRQSVVSVLAGVALSFIPLGLTTLAGKRSGQPTMVVSRATFGLVGNVIPAILGLVTRVFWGAVLLWVLASSVAIILVGAALDGGLGDRQLLLISLAVAFLIALLVAFAGYPLFARIQLILSVISAILVVGLIALTWRYVDISAALTTPDGPWELTVTGAVLVFSFVGLVWANSGADLARYQRPSSSGAASMLWATVGTTLPTFALIAYGALLAASDKGIAAGFLGSPLDTLSLMLPNWYPVPLLAATGLSLLSGVILTLYSGGFALQAIGLQVRRQWSIVIVAVLLAGLALLLTFGVAGGMAELFRDAATTLAVPTAAWAGIFAAETMIRNRRFETQSLLVRGGVYPDVRWLNLIALIVISAIGFGLTTATVTWLSWQGYGFTLLGMPLNSDLAASDLGVLVALVLGLLVPLVAGVPAIRRQEALRPNI